MSSLTEAKTDTTYIIRAIQANHQLEKRLFHLGFFMGQKIRVLARAPFSGPFIILTESGDKIALRKEEASSIQVTLS